MHQNMEHGNRLDENTFQGYYDNALKVYKQSFLLMQAPKDKAARQTWFRECDALIAHPKTESEDYVMATFAANAAVQVWQMHELSEYMRVKGEIAAGEIMWNARKKLQAPSCSV
ncbi:uncharacterized protein FIBRA_02184 [Fibroporia radiculosa]|uniref:Uncharacterized protein n=1 Tax=Fibroporia radiculosa TaxID=599839 RepID=J4I8X2_9APHY|nr:uncharacterized protein FIBRA_02184 [Fibroporia radiculosa]CCM00156.1 predicted protein [Fibroporia radiculosa]